jgi:hypothetical protein
MNCLGRSALEVRVLAAPSGDFTTLGEPAAGRNSHEMMTPGNFPAQVALEALVEPQETLKELVAFGPAEV